MARLPLIALLLILAVGLSGCELIGDLIEFGLWMVLIVIVLVVALLVWIVRKIF